MTQPFEYTEDAIAAISHSLSPVRFQKYLDASDGDEVAAIQLYAWNTAIAGAFYGPLQTLEVLLRNKIHQQLGASHGARWFENTQLLRDAEIQRASEAVQYLNDRNKSAAADSVVAELSFAFWVALFANVYDESIWRTDLHKLFPQQIRDRRKLHMTLDKLRTLRNRIAHHEPIHQRKLADDYGRIRFLVGALDIATLRWLTHHSGIESVMETEVDQITGW